MINYYLKGSDIKVFDVVILGGGASALMCASMLNEKKSLDIAIVDANKELGSKIKISGGGKCNITNVNVNEDNYLGDAEFVREVFKSYSKEDLLSFIEKNRVILEIRKNRYYFCKESATKLIDLFKSKIRGVKLFLNETILHVDKGADFCISTNKQKLYAKKVIVATGGESFKNLNASAIGLEIAKSFEDDVKLFEPSLVGLTLQPQQSWMKQLSGISLHVEVQVNDKILDEEMLFAHRGISGPVVLSTSLYWKKGQFSINFLPNVDLLNRIKSSKKIISKTLDLPRRFVTTFLEHIELEDKACNTLTSQDLDKLLTIQNYSFAPAGNFGFSKAEVSRGGVLTSQIDVNSMQSKKNSGLFYIGEVVDVTGELGGYNFQWAFSSAVICANFIKNI